jgi:hypothetical protein
MAAHILYMSQRGSILPPLTLLQTKSRQTTSDSSGGIRIVAKADGSSHRIVERILFQRFPLPAPQFRDLDRLSYARSNNFSEHIHHFIT